MRLHARRVQTRSSRRFQSAQDCVGGDDGRDPAEQGSAEALAFGREPAVLIVTEAESASSKLLLEHLVFLEQILDGVRLLAVRPATEDREQEL